MKKLWIKIAWHTILWACIIYLFVVMCSCSTSKPIIYNCATYLNAKPTTVKVGSYNPIKPRGLNVGKTLVIN